MKLTLVIFLFVLCLLSLTGCQIGYLVKSGFNQMALLGRGESLEKALNDPKVDESTKSKIRLVREAKNFAFTEMGLTRNRNYERFVKLDDRYITYVVSAAPKDKLEPYLWSFPIVGKVPYKGYFNKSDAEDEKKSMEEKNYDVEMRGVSAYSTLGWFPDPLLSSMIAYDDAELVETVIHESTHATVYIKSNAEFNERLATFVGNKGMEEFYKSKGQSNPGIDKAKLMAQDAKTFSEFISEELKTLAEFYKINKDSKTLLADRDKAFDRIKKNFTLACEPKLKTDSYKGFVKRPLNNAVLLGFKTYYQDLSIFEKAFEKLKTWHAFMDYFKSLKNSETPEKDLKSFLNQ